MSRASRASVKKRSKLRIAVRERDGDDCHLCGGLMIFGNPKSEDYASSIA